MSPFRDDRRDLIARVDSEVRDRIWEAVDFVCLDVMAARRRDRGLPPMAPDSASDRAEFEANVETFLTRLGDDLGAALDPERRRALGKGGDRVTGLLDVQVALAKLLPDYWQRFEDVRAAFAGDATGAEAPSGRDRPAGWLGRLFGG